MTQNIDALVARVRQELAQLELEEQRTATRLEALSDRRKGLVGVLEGIDLTVRMLAEESGEKPEDQSP